MEIQLAYKKLLAEYNLTENKLPEDAQTGIAIINDIIRGINLAEKKGQKVSPKTITKLRANDKWVVREIIDFVEGTDKNEDNVPFEAKEVLEEMKDDKKPKDEEAVVDVNKSVGNKIDAELTTILNDGKETISAEELKKLAPATYYVLFKNYKKGEENGVQTNNYLLKETEEEVFTINKL